MAVHVLCKSWYISLPSSAKQQRELTKALSTRIRMFLNPQLFLSGYGYPSHITGELDTIACFMAHALNTFSNRGALGTTVNPDTIGCAWTSEFDLNTLREDGDIFESGKKKDWV